MAKRDGTDTWKEYYKSDPKVLRVFLRYDPNFGHGGRVQCVSLDPDAKNPFEDEYIEEDPCGEKGDIGYLEWYRGGYIFFRHVQVPKAERKNGGRFDYHIATVRNVGLFYITVENDNIGNVRIRKRLFDKNCPECYDELLLKHNPANSKDAYTIIQDISQLRKAYFQSKRNQNNK